VSRGDDDRVADILEAADQVALLVGRGRSEFDADIAVRFAVERLLEIIGEASNAVSDDGRDRYQGVEWQEHHSIADRPGTPLPPSRPGSSLVHRVRRLAIAGSEAARRCSVRKCRALVADDVGLVG
jgi:hypothetical protein